MGLFNLFRKKTATGDNNPPVVPASVSPIPKVTKSADQIISELESSNYFIYADPTHLQQLRSEFGKVLAEEQYNLIRPLIHDLRECPLPTKEWCKVWGVTWVNVIV